MPFFLANPSSDFSKKIDRENRVLDSKSQKCSVKGEDKVLILYVCISGSTSGDPGIGDGCRNGRQATISNSKLSWSRMKKRLAESLSHVGGGARALSSAPTARATATSRQGNSF